jgi:hypothetical protein
MDVKKNQKFFHGKKDTGIPVQVPICKEKAVATKSSINTIRRRMYPGTGTEEEKNYSFLAEGPMGSLVKKNKRGNNLKCFLSTGTFLTTLLNLTPLRFHCVGKSWD